MRRCIGDGLTLRPREGDFEAREKGTSAVLCTNTLGTSDEVYVHTEGGRIRVIVDLDLREETKGGWRETEGYHTGSGMGLVKAVGGTLEGDALKVTKTREDELDEHAEEVVHLRALEVDLDTDGYTGTDPTLQVLATPDDLDTLCGVLSTGLIVGSGDCAKSHDGTKEVGATGCGLLDLGVNLNAFKLDDGVGRGRGWELL